MGDEQLDFIRIGIACPKCGQKPQEIIRQLIDRDTVPCSFCGFKIDLRTHENQAMINKSVDSFKSIGPLIRE